MSQPALLDSQLWLLTAMTAGGGLEHGLALAQANYGLDEEMVAEPPQGDRRSRIGVYHHGYWMRLLECLRADYPMLGKLLGPSMFDLLARGYLAAWPSRSPSLHDLGEGFAAFLASSQPDPDAVECRLPVELARLERAHAEALRGEGVEAVEPEPQDDWLTLLAVGEPLAAYRVPDCVRLLETSLPVHEYCLVLAVEENAPPIPAPAACFLAVARAQWRVQCHELELWQWRMLHAMRQGASAGEALSEAMAAAGMVEEALRAQLLLWLPAARQLGLLRRDAG